MKPGKRSKPRKIPEILTVDEQSRLLDALKPSTRIKLRNRAMVILMLDAGLRSAEVVALRHRDIEWEAGKLTVRNGKGGRDRVLWLPDEDLALLRQYADSSSIQDSSSLLFQTGTGKPIDTRFLRAMLERVGRKAGIERLHPHLLRHTFATDLLRQTKNLFLVSKALGHADLSSTQIYLHLVDDEMEDAMKNLRNDGG